MTGAHRTPARQRGVAVVTALLLTTLAITIVASLFWQQQVQVRLIENQRYQLQKQWVLRGALDWARLILREDARVSNVDFLSEPWAVPLAPTRLDQYVENQAADGDVGTALLSGNVIDAQSRFNLTNLATQGRVNLETEVPAFRKLLTSLDLSEQIAVPIAEAIAAAQSRGQPPAGQGQGQEQEQEGQEGQEQEGRDDEQRQTDGRGQAGVEGQDNGQAPGITVASRPSMPLLQVDDLLSVPGVTPEILAKMRDYVIILPVTTRVNANTASAPVLAARIESLTLAEAAAFVASRERAHVLNMGDLETRLNRSSGEIGSQVDLVTQYFIVNGTVRLGRGALNMSALVHRPDTRQPGAAPRTTLVWMREN